MRAIQKMGCSTTYLVVYSDKPFDNKDLEYIESESFINFTYALEDILLMYDSGRFYKRSVFSCHGCYGGGNKVLSMVVKLMKNQKE